MICHFCGHDEHERQCIQLTELLYGHKQCPCKGSFREMSDEVEPKPFKPSCAAHELMPLSVSRCGAKNTAKEPEVLRQYVVQIGGASGTVWLCKSHLRAVRSLSGVSVAEVAA